MNLTRVSRPALRHARAPNGARRRLTCGFSLLEVLVSILVLSFGLLGMAGMQAASLQLNREARLQSQAMSFAQELSDMIRGNKAIGLLLVNNPYLLNDSSPLAAGTPSYCLSVAATTPCADATEIANAEVTDWLARLDADLPGARVVSCYDAAPFDASGNPRWGCTVGAGMPIVIKIGWTRSSTNKSLTGAQALERTGDTGSIPHLVLQVTAGGV